MNRFVETKSPQIWSYQDAHGGWHTDNCYMNGRHLVGVGGTPVCTSCSQTTDKTHTTLCDACQCMVHNKTGCISWEDPPRCDASYARCNDCEELG